ncbi:MAG: UPF0182 family protein [Methanobacteriota archaeon]|nr:MAG: UPF0182 family protein [Euryarchaeota archaeon]
MAGNWTKLQIALLLILIMAFTAGIGLYTDYLWFQSMGYGGVFLTILKTKAALAIGAAAIFFVFAYINATAASRSYAVSRTRDDEAEVILPEDLSTIILGIIAAASVLFGIALSGSWEEVLRYLNKTPFGISDPVFGRDAAFYVFDLPFYETALRAAFLMLVFIGAITLLVYLLKSKSILFDMTFSDIRFEIPKFTSWAKAHLLLLLAAFFILMAASYRLQAYNLLLSSRSDTFFGPGYTDLTVTLPALGLLAALSTLTAISMVLTIWIKRPWIPAGFVVILIAVHTLGLGFYAGIVQEYRVRPNEISLETPYIKNNIEHTVKAFNLEKVDDQPFEVSANLTAEDLDKNAPTIRNIRLWDPRPLKDTYKQIQEIRLYYEFNDVDVDRYDLDGEYVEVMLSAREIDTSQLSESARNWINEHLVYTHGYGVVASPVNTIGKQGLPELLIKDIPPESQSFKIERPEIYFGERTDNYVIVKTRQREFDYPRGNENQYTTYEADSGVQLNSYVRKLAMAIRFGTPKIILSEDITDESRILFNRNIKTLTSTIAPFLAYDRDPYLVVSGGRLYWIIDGYTTTARYPYSTPYSGINYIRNPVKVVVDAYTGETDFYIVDERDPIINTYAGIFPGLFRPYSEMPEDLKRHLRYPEDMFTIQAAVYAKYHMTDPVVFYNLEDMWNIPNELYENQRIPMEPYYIIMKLPGEEKEEFLLMQPFTPRNKDNMIAWMYARSDPGHYGELGVFKFPKQELIFGPAQVEARIDQDERISEQLTLWGQVGSRVIRGNLLVIPVENSILYVEPLYLLAEQSRLPELKRVIVAYGDDIVMEETLDEALAAIFGETAAPATETAPTTGPTEDLPTLALQHYNNAMEALKAGDWAGFGEELGALEEVLQKMKEKQKA